ncbi:MAG: helix-turn-helix domain-containing protein [Hyphomicrobiaceae bacterium]
MNPAVLEVPSPRLDLGNHDRTANPNIDDALDAKVRSVYFAVSMVYSIERGILDHPTRGRSRVAFARQVAMYLAHIAFGLTLTTVGRAFGRDRTTVSHACALVEDARDDPEIDRTLELLEAIVKRLASLDPSHL